MSVYLTLSQVNKIVYGLGLYNAKLVDYRGLNSYEIKIKSQSFMGWQEVLSLKRRNGNNFKVTQFNDVIDGFRDDNGKQYLLRYKTSVYGKPKTANELYKRLAKLKENIKKMEKEAKQYKVFEKKLEILKDFNNET
jgi:hypothetical protein